MRIYRQSFFHYITENGLRHASGPIHSTNPSVTYIDRVRLKPFNFIIISYKLTTCPYIKYRIPRIVLTICALFVAHSCCYCVFLGGVNFWILKICYKIILLILPFMYSSIIFFHLSMYIMTNIILRKSYLASTNHGIILHFEIFLFYSIVFDVFFLKKGPLNPMRKQ